MTTNLQQRLLDHLEQLARPHHAQWDRLGLMAVRTFIQEQLATLGKVEKHHYQQMSDTIDTLDLPFLAAVTKGLDSALSRL